jgi:hypothetical protein
MPSPTDSSPRIRSQPGPAPPRHPQRLSPPPPAPRACLDPAPAAATAAPGQACSALSVNPAPVSRTGHNCSCAVSAALPGRRVHGRGFTHPAGNDLAPTTTSAVELGSSPLTGDLAMRALPPLPRPRGPRTPPPPPAAAHCPTPPAGPAVLDSTSDYVPPLKPCSLLPTFPRALGNFCLSRSHLRVRRSVHSDALRPSSHGTHGPH